MKNQTNIPPGYKPSPLGPIPQDWEVVKLGAHVDITSGVSPSLFSLLIDGKYPYLKVEDLNNCEKYQTISREYSNDEKYLVPSNSVIFPKRGAAILNNKVRINSLPVQMDSNLMAIYPSSNSLITEFLYYRITFEELHKIADTSTIPQINNKHILPYNFLLPPLPEQKAIAGVLSAWDEAIQATTQLIKAKERQKGALTQKLLSGKVRLKGFNEKWRFEKIASVAKEVSIKNKDDRDLIVLSCTKYKGLVPSLEYFGRKIFSDDLTTYKIVPKNHFAYATNHIEEGSIGYQAQLEAGLISPMYTVFKTDGMVDDDFMFKLLKSHDYIHEYNKRMEGSIDRRGGLRWDEFSKIKMPVPPLEEQAAISMVLQTADKEIILLKSKLDSLKEQKKGLMQQLLTGKKRLKINQN